MKDQVDENIDRLTKEADGVTWLINCALKKHEFSIVVYHDRLETDIIRQPSIGVT